jgi:hypothetical protein
MDRILVYFWFILARANRPKDDWGSKPVTTVLVQRWL